jgi:hypothetical protein
VRRVGTQRISAGKCEIRNENFSEGGRKAPVSTWPQPAKLIGSGRARGLFAGGEAGSASGGMAGLDALHPVPQLGYVERFFHHAGDA